MVEPENPNELSFAQLRERLEKLREVRADIARKLWRHVGVAIVVVMATGVSARLFSQDRLSAVNFLAAEGVGTLILVAILGRVMWLIRKQVDPVNEEIHYYDAELKWRADNL